MASSVPSPFKASSVDPKEVPGSVAEKTKRRMAIINKDHWISFRSFCVISRHLNRFAMACREEA